MKSASLWLLPALCLPACGSADQQPDKPAPPTAAVSPAPTTPAAPVAADPDTVVTPVLSAAEQARRDTVKQLDTLIQARYPYLQVIDFRSGDINADGRRDMIVVAEAPCDFVSGYRERTALLLLNTGTARLHIAAVNNGGLVNSMSCEEKSYEGYTHVEIQDRTFTFHGHQPHTGYDVVFRYDKVKRDWLLYRRVRSYLALGDPKPDVTRETPRNFGVVRFADYDGGVMEF